MKCQFWGTLLLICAFLSGLGGGVLLDRHVLLLHTRQYQRAMTLDERKHEMLSECRQQLQLADDQAKQLTVIVEAHQPRFIDCMELARAQREAIIADFRNDVRVLLTPQQREVFEKMVQDYDRKMAERRQQFLGQAAK